MSACLYFYLCGDPSELYTLWSEDISYGSHNFKVLFEGSDLVLVQVGTRFRFTSGLVEVWLSKCKKAHRRSHVAATPPPPGQVFSATIGFHTCRGAEKQRWARLINASHWTVRAGSPTVYPAQESPPDQVKGRKMEP